MEERESQEKLLEAETKIRLEKLRQRIPASSQTQANVQTSASRPVEEEKTKKNSVDAESRAKWAYKRFVEITK